MTTKSNANPESDFQSSDTRSRITLGYWSCLSLDTSHYCSDKSYRYKPVGQPPQHNMPDGMPVGKSKTWPELLSQSRFENRETFRKSVSH